MRGIGILLVCLGHSISTMNVPLNVSILSFHMPLFFFISGIFISDKLSFRDFLKKKAVALILPQMTLSIFAIAREIFLDVLMTKKNLSLKLTIMFSSKVGFCPHCFLWKLYYGW